MLRLIKSTAQRAALPSVRGLHQSALLLSQRAATFAQLRKQFGPGYAEETVPVKELLSGFKSLQSERLLTNNNEKAAFYRDAYRDVCQIADSRDTLKVGEIAEVLTEENAVAWRAITNLLSIGEIPELAGMDEEKAAAVLFGRVHGIGPSRAKELAELGYRSLDDLRNSSSKLIKKATRIALNHLEETERPIPRKEMEIFYGIISDALKKADPEIKFELTGSFRRGQAFALTVDLAIWHESYSALKDNDVPAKALMDKVKAALSDAGLMSRDLVFLNGIKKSMVLTKVPERILPGAGYRLMDIRLCNTTSVPYFLLANTGDETLMKIMRRAAFDRELVLNEYGMGKRNREKKNSNWWVEGIEIVVNSEEEIFEHLRVPYLKPIERSFKTYEKMLPRYLLSA
ncbi:hypothetical protein NCC49_001365 [Naganishia albida]|nr:hypothetical protein NCC49_001365 [Naganishia albida]